MGQNHRGFGVRPYAALSQHKHTKIGKYPSPFRLPSPTQKILKRKKGKEKATKKKKKGQEKATKKKGQEKATKNKNAY